MEFIILGVLGSPDYALVALGFVFIFSVVRAYPFHQGGLVLLATYVYLYSFEYSGNILLSLAILIIVILALSLVISKFAFERLLGKHFASIIVAFGILTIIESIARQYLYGGRAVAYPEALTLDGTVSVLGTEVNSNRVLAFLAGVAMMVLLDQFFKRTRPGMRMRATADSPVGAQICGVNTTWAIRGAFLLAGIAAATGGVLLGLSQTSVSPALAGPLTINGLAAALLGGSTSLRGAVVAAVFISVTQSVAIGYLSSTFSSVITFVVIIGVILIRPHGILGRAEASHA